MYISDLEAWCKISFREFSSNPLGYAHHLYLNGEEINDLVIPNSITSIPAYAFNNCTGLTSVTIPNNITLIESHTFQNCSGLTSVAISNGVTCIEMEAFLGCSSLTSVTIPNSVTSIKYGAFQGCIGLTSVTIGNSLTSIEACTFENCSSLTSVTIPNSVTNIGNGALRNCTSLTSVIIGNSVTNIGNDALRGCTSLTSVTIPNSVTNIGICALQNCTGLTSVTIGHGIKTIQKEAFASCPELTDVYCHAINVPATNFYAFSDSYINYATLHVPTESVNAYKAADPWKNFKSIVSLEGGDTPEPPEPQKCEKPTISYNNGQLKFASATDGVEFVSEITDSDIKKNYEATVTLTATYNISVYATKTGYDNSDVATATLCWIDKEPTTEGITDGVAQISSKAVLIQSEGGILKVEGVDDGTQVAVYTPDGKQAGSAVCRNGAALVGTNIQPGNTAIVKVGNKSVKIMVK